MYVTAADLRVIRREGVLTRFAVLGPVAYVLADMAQGASGTSLEASCVERHWAIVLRATLELERADLTALPAGTAFHVPAGEPHHRFHGSDPVVVAGFAPLASTLDLRHETHSATGSEVLRTMHRPPPLPATIRLARPGITYRAGHGAIEVETATIGETPGDEV